MKVSCPGCKTIYTIPAEKITDQERKAICKKCGEDIIIRAGYSSSGNPLPSISDGLGGPGGQQISGHNLLAYYPGNSALASGKVDFTTAFSPNIKGGYKTSYNTFKLKILRAVHTVLDEVLHDDEQVRHIGQGLAYYPAELLLGNGWLTMMYNSYAILCTNKRILFININSRMSRPKHYYFQMYYQEIKKVTRGLLLKSLVLVPKKGKKRIFTSMKSYLSKELKEFITSRLTETGAAGFSGRFYKSLCPACFAPQDPGLIACASCNASFKRPRNAMLLSFFMPGLGDMYLGHRILGLFELIGSLAIWSLLLLPTVAEAQPDLAAIPQPVLIGLIALYNGFDGLMTYFMARKGYMLAGKK